MVKPEEKRPLGRSRRKWEDNMGKVGCDPGDGLDILLKIGRPVAILCKGSNELPGSLKAN